MPSYKQSQQSTAYSAVVNKVASFQYDASASPYASTVNDHFENRYARAWVPQTDSLNSSIDLTQASEFTIWKIVNIPAFGLEYSIKPTVALEQEMKYFIWDTAPPLTQDFSHTIIATRHIESNFEYEMDPDIPFLGVTGIFQLYSGTVEATLAPEFNILTVALILQDMTFEMLPDVDTTISQRHDIWDTSPSIETAMNHDVLADVSVANGFEFSFGTDVPFISDVGLEYIIYDVTLVKEYAPEINIYDQRVDLTASFEHEIIFKLELQKDQEFVVAIRQHMPNAFYYVDRTFAHGIYNIYQSLDTQTHFSYDVGTTKVHKTKSFRHHIDLGASGYGTGAQSYTTIVYLDDVPVTDQIEQCTVSYGIKQHVGTVAIRWANPGIYEHISVTEHSYWGQPRIRVETDGVSHGEFILDQQGAQMSPQDTDLTSNGRTAPALLGDPYAVPITKVWNDTMMASEIATELATAEGVVLSWEVHDYKILLGNLSATEELPISIISKLAKAVGGILTTNAAGELRVVYRFGSE